MSIILDGTTGITTPGLTNTGTETIVNLTTTGNTILGDATTDTLNVGAGGLVKDASGNVGIGTSSPYSNAAFATLGIGGSGSSKTGLISLVTAAGVDSAHIDVYNSQLRISTNGTSNPIAFYTGGSVTQNLTLDSSGNLGLGVSPTSSLTNYRFIQLGSTGVNYFGGAGSVGFNYNGYYDAGWKYNATGAATLFDSDGSQFRWNQAVSGTAGTAISFTQAMTLDASGNLGIGTSSPSAKLDVRGSGYFINASSPTSFWSVDSALTTGSGYCQWNTSSNEFRVQSYTNHPLVFGTNNTEQMRITAGGNLLIGNTAGNSKLTVNGAISTSNGSAITSRLTTQAYQTSVSTTATTIATGQANGALVLVTGYVSGGSNQWTDLVFYAYNTVNVISTINYTGAPAARTYSVSTYDLKVRMASGTYIVDAAELEVIAN